MINFSVSKHIFVDVTITSFEVKFLVISKLINNGNPCAQIASFYGTFLLLVFSIATPTDLSLLRVLPTFHL